MSVKEAISKLEASAEFKAWRKNNPDSFLAHSFTMREGDRLEPWQIGYYNNNKKLVTVFELCEPIKILPESEVFKKEENEIRPIVWESLKTEFDEAMKIALKINREHYPQIISNRQIVILQNTELGQIWNLTFISHSLDVLNIKIDSSNGGVLKHSLTRLFEFKNFSTAS